MGDGDVTVITAFTDILVTDRVRFKLAVNK